VDDIVERLRDGWDLDDADRIDAVVEIEVTREQLAHLQALIDEYATARQRCRDSVALSHATYAAACDALYMAEEALLAAATPQEAES
jgi:hypothetical protein